LTLLLSVPAGGGGVGHLSLVAKTQYCAVVVVSRGGWYQVTVSLLPPLQSTRSAGDWARMSFDLLCNATCVNSCGVRSDAHNSGWYNKSGYDSIYTIHPVSVPIRYRSDHRQFSNMNV